MAEEQRWQEPGNHRPCANNCGFFGSPTTLHLCSKCYKDYCMKEQNMKDAHTALETTTTTTTICQSESSIPPSLQTNDSEPTREQLLAPRVATESSSAVKPNGCGVCPKRVLEKTICQLESLVPPTPASVLPSLQTESEPPAEQLVAPTVATGSSSAARPNRCGACRKRVGLTGFACRCGVTFCGSHRYPEKHGCGFDYKAVGREAIAKANPVIKGEKLNKI